MPIKRNDRCWCGSGLKYKKCHLNREEQKPENPFNISKKFHELQKRKFCFCEYDKTNCSDVYAASHSISKSGSLGLIAENSHVSAVQGDFHFHRGADSYYESLRIISTSLNKASTFHGFCSYHDGHIFQQLDRLDLKDPPRFFWQLFYRAAAYEKYSKIVAVDFADQIRHLDKGTNVLEQQNVQFEANVNKWSHEEGLKKISSLLQSLEAILLKSSFGDVLFYYAATDRQLPFAGVGCFQPTVGIDGQILQRVNLILPKELFVYSPEIDSVCVAAIPTKSSTLLCFSALRSQKKATEFIKAFANEQQRVASLFFGMMMLSIENVYFRPSFLRGVNSQEMSILKRLSIMGIGEDLTPQDIPMARAISIFDDISIVRQASNFSQ